MQVSEGNPSAPADSPSVDAHIPTGPSLGPDPGPDSQPSGSINNFNNECKSNVPIFHGTTSHPDSHLDSPHPTQAETQIDQTISSTGSGPVRRLSASSPKMLFSDLYKSTKSPLSRLRHHSHPAPAALDYDPDLVSRDKAKQKEAIKRVLAAKIRNDWHFEWPPAAINPDPGHAEPETAPEGHHDDIIVEDIDLGDDTASVYSTVSEDLTQFRPRSEWLSDMPDDDDDDIPVSPSAYRFDTPDAVGTSVKVAALAKSAKRRRAVRSEMEWNHGLACFNARRDAWTGAKAARIRPKATSPVVSSPAAKRLSWWHISTSPSPSSPTESIGAGTTLSPSATRTSGDTTAVSSSDAEFRETRARDDSSTYPVETLVPIPQPLLPPATPMRASITAAAYPTIYDKIVVQSATPSCPVNLGDVVRSCVAGWKRDGEWPPRGTDPPPVVAIRRKKDNDAGGRNNAPKSNASKRMSFSFLGRRQSVGGDHNNLAESTSHPENENASHTTGKAFRKGLQRVLGLGHGGTLGNTTNQAGIAM